MSKYIDTFKPNSFYHVFNRAVGSEDLFREEKNIIFFMNKMKLYLKPCFDFYAYCLLQNHFHFVIKTKSEEEIYALQIRAQEKLQFHSFCMKQFARFAVSYAKSYNKYYNRKGSLFIEYLKRVELKKDKDVISAIFYVHKNPVHHGYVTELSDWTNSSFNAIKNNWQDEFVDTEKVLHFFGSEDEFIKVHKQNPMR